MKKPWIADIDNCLPILSRGGIILYPTDTIWGIGCDATNSEAVARIFQLKNRPDHKTMIVLLADQSEISNYADVPDTSLFNYLQNSDRPTTVIYQGAKNLAPSLVAADQSIAIRICRDPFCKELIHAFGKPIVSTSPNFSGQPTPSIFELISNEIKKSVDYLVQYRQDETEPGKPSVILRWENGEAVILRG